ncbi:sensor histidine kinase [Falsigemmobacter faecalis]|uniref:histidine kinase n=1 Tax=Falsigemmobacter faecalis TaxID=2488730 RepID=A0A3P3DUJ2_9RHOB|nr:HAMP domain-containing sensor histidine kinase [Falsigemmobacter faecalis]RRH77859.1 sensor histidine kinase [Falsigemmobacter faecalis]
MLNSLSGRFLGLTLTFVLLAEVLIFLPSVAGFREDWMKQRLDKAQIAALARLTTDGPVDENLEAELLANAGVFNVVLRRDEARQLILSSPIPAPVAATYDLRFSGVWDLVRDAMAAMLGRGNEVIRIIGTPSNDAGLLIEVTTESAPLREALLESGLRILLTSALIVAATALLLFMAVHALMVRPIGRVVEHIKAYAASPEDAHLVITPTSSLRELREAEEALQSMQTRLTGALRQKERLAQLGAGVAKISHDLRNILASAQLFADRLETSEDPKVARMAPKLLNSISRAVTLCETTLSFGKADEAEPRLGRLRLQPLVEEVLSGEGLDTPGQVAAIVDLPPDLTIEADGEQIYRVFANLIRNARQAIEATGKGGEIEISGAEDEASVWIRVGDTGPGLPKKARENLFAAFQGSSRKGGTGLGLVIAAELVRGHGGTLELLRSDTDGTEFLITLPGIRKIS